MPPVPLPSPASGSPCSAFCLWSCVLGVFCGLLNPASPAGGTCRGPSAVVHLGPLCAHTGLSVCPSASRCRAVALSGSVNSASVSAHTPRLWGGPRCPCAPSPVGAGRLLSGTVPSSSWWAAGWHVDAQAKPGLLRDELCSAWGPACGTRVCREHAARLSGGCVGMLGARGGCHAP